MTYKVKVK